MVEPSQNFLIILLLTVSSLCAEVTGTFNQVQAENWREMEDFVDHLTDGLGMPIDAKIKEMVIVLNLLGIETRQSCEGHLDRGYPYSWIDINRGKEARELENQRSELLKEIDEVEKIIYTEVNISPLALDELKSQYTNKCKENKRLFDLIDGLYFDQKNKLWTLLDEFYEGNESFKDGTLIFINWRLFSYGGHLQCRYSDEEKHKNLIRYQAEMDLFKDFLIKKYLELNS